MASNFKQKENSMDFDNNYDKTESRVTIEMFGKANYYFLNFLKVYPRTLSMLATWMLSVLLLAIVVRFLTSELRIFGMGYIGLGLLLVVFNKASEATTKGAVFFFAGIAMILFGAMVLY
jgi:hypothetical protein